MTAFVFIVVGSNLCLHVNLLGDCAVSEGDPGVGVGEGCSLVANGGSPLHVDGVNMLRFGAGRLLEGNGLNTLDYEIINDLWIKNTTWPSVPVTFSTPGQGLSWLPAGEVTQAVEVSRKTVKMS